MSDGQKTPPWLLYLFPRLGEILFVAVFIACIGLGPRMMNMDGDLGRHLTLGNYILDSGQIPTRDIFSFSKLGDPLTPHEWLADVIFALFARWGGLDGVVWLTALLISCSIWVIYAASARVSGMSLLAGFLTVLAAAASSLHWLTRPHIFTILLAAVWTFLLEEFREGQRRNWLVFPVLMLVWVNVHGAFFAGLLIWACYLAGLLLEGKWAWKDLRPYLGIGLLSLLVSFANPDGIGIWKTGFGFLSNSYLVGHTAEYLPPNFRNSATWPFLILLLISLVVLAFSRRKVPFHQLLLIGGWSVLSLYSARNIPLYAAAAVPALCGITADLLRDREGSRPVRRLAKLQEGFQRVEKDLRGGFWSAAALVVAAGLLASGVKLDFEKRGNQFLPDVFPVKAVGWMAGHSPDGRGFNYFPWGGYLLYTRWPESLVFIDGQTDFYGEELTRQYEKVITLQGGWQDILEEYGIAWVLMPTGSDLVRELDRQEGWRILYADETAELVARSEWD